MAITLERPRADGYFHEQGGENDLLDTSSWRFRTDSKPDLCWRRVSPIFEIQLKLLP
jgi:hypothetical protein